MSETQPTNPLPRSGYVFCVVLMSACLGAAARCDETEIARSISSLSPLPPPATPPGQQVVLGRLLFHDPRLSGDATISCASCHDPARAWTDGLPLSQGYPGSLYFRNTPTVMNMGHARYAYWDGRLPAADLATLVRDHISEAHFMQADGRLVIERLRQVPEYEKGFERAFGGEPTYGRILNAVAAYLKTLQTRDAPLDRYLRGDQSALTAAGKRGLDLFLGKAGCVRCHSGPMLSDGDFHNFGMPGNNEVFVEPLRHVSFRRFFRTLGVSEYAMLRSDVGRYAITKQAEDVGRFRTPSLWEVSRTAPYMHDGSLPTLEHVVEFYDEGGVSGSGDPATIIGSGDPGTTNRNRARAGVHAGSDASLAPLKLTAAEKADLVELLRSLASPTPQADTPELPSYELRKLGEN